jgi:tetratricopeptide (TPR) repeat protein
VTGGGGRTRTLLSRITGAGARSWVLAGLLGVLLVMSLSVLWDAWTLNVAGLTLNRLVTAQVNATTLEGTAEPASRDPLGGSSLLAEDPAALFRLEYVLALVEAAADRAPHIAARETAFWRTYGAAARFVPSDQAYGLLSRARDAGSLDRIGELWFAEVALATGHVEEAATAYERIDATNLLLYRAETALEAGEKALATRQFVLAYDSLRAALEREANLRLLSEMTGSELSVGSRLLRQSAERVTSLYRIGRGLLNADEPAQAVPILEGALEAAEVNSPGTVTHQSLYLSLAMALARVLPADDAPTASPLPAGSALDEQARKRILGLDRIRALVAQGMSMDQTGSACLRAGRILLLIGDKVDAAGYLKRAVELDPLVPESYLLLGAYYRDTGRPSTARELYRRGHEALPADAALAAAHAVASYRTMPADYALPLLEQAAQMTQVNDPSVFACLGDCYVGLGMKGHAFEAYRAGLRRFPGEAVLLHRLAGLPFSHNLVQ